jgi:hypothetical protein
MVPFLCPELTDAYVPFIEDKLINMSSIGTLFNVRFIQGSVYTGFGLYRVRFTQVPLCYHDEESPATFIGLKVEPSAGASVESLEQLKETDKLVDNKSRSPSIDDNLPPQMYLYQCHFPCF